MERDIQNAIKQNTQETAKPSQYKNPKATKRRTVAINKLKRMKQYGSIIGVVWARRYLLKASEAKLEVSTATRRG